MKNLSGERYGCLTLAHGSEVKKQRENIEKLFEYQREYAKKEYVPTGRFPSQFEYILLESNYADLIQKAESNEGFICQCKCGYIFYYPSGRGPLWQKKPRYCDTGSDIKHCGIRKEHKRKMTDSYPREKHPSYDIDFSNTVHETLRVLKCVDENFEGEFIVDDIGKKRVIVYKKYRCQCQLCAKEYEFLSSDFEIKLGPVGYDSKARCECHAISSFQWRTIKIFEEYGIKYWAEYWDQDLYVPWSDGKYLRYDFAIVDSNNEIMCFVECNGEQHYKPIAEFDGEEGYRQQKRNDEKKEQYADEKNIPLIIIPYTYNTYEKESKFLVSKLKEKGIITP